MAKGGKGENTKKVAGNAKVRFDYDIERWNRH
jgi:hypothetical protein